MVKMLNRRTNMIIRVLPALIAAVFILCLLTPISVYAKDPDSKSTDSKSTDSTVPRIINIVYDDSASMVPKDGSDQRWCSAMYALEVFTAMMGENDVINIYRMSEYDSSNTGDPVIKTIKGNESTRVTQVHNLECDYKNTPFRAIRTAAEDLQKEPDSYDRWLVILTDGAKFSFDDTNSLNDVSAKESTEKLSESLNEYAGNVKVAYLGIGAEAANISVNSGNLQTWTARTSEEILTKVTEIANSIFEHQILDSGHISVSGSTYTLTTDIPTKQIIIFAQGENVSIGKLKLNGDDIKGEQLNVKYCDENEKGFPKSTMYNVQPSVDNYRNLKGIVAVFDAGEDPFADGSFDVDISGASKVEIYYKAGVVPTCILYDEDGNIPDYNDGITAGEYTVEVGFLNPLNGQAVTSDMLNVVSSDVTVINNGKELDISSGRIELEEGETQISTCIELEGNVRAESYVESRIKPKAVNIEVRFDNPEEAYKAQNLDESARPVTATLIDKTTGTTITQEQWDACKVSVSGDKDDKYIKWDIQKGNSVGTFEIRPLLKSNKNVTKVESGKHYFEMEINLKNDDQKISETASGSAMIEGYEGTTLVIVAENIDTPVRIPAIKDFPGIKATVYTTDDTGAQIPISEDVWNCLKLKISRPKTKRVKWTIEKGDEIGTYYIKPGYPWGLSLFMYGAVNGREEYPEYTAGDGIIVNRASDISTTVKAAGELGPMIFSGEGEAGLKVAPLTLKEIWSLIWKYVAAFALLAIFTAGELSKKRISRKIAPHIVYGKSEVDCAFHIKRKIFPLFKPERATIENCDSTMKCGIPNMYIEAATAKSFRILNAKEVFGNSIRVKEEVLGPPDAEKVAKRKYAYSGYNMAPISRGGKRVGMFHMTRKK